MAEAASRQAAPVVPSVPPAKDATSAGDHGLVTGGQIPLDPAHDSGVPSGGATLSPSNELDRAGTDASSPAIQPNASEAAAELTATPNHVASTAPAVPVAQHASPAPTGHNESSASFDLTGRIAHEITDTVGQIVVRLGQFAESGGMTGLDGFGEFPARRDRRRCEPHRHRPGGNIQPVPGGHERRWRRSQACRRRCWPRFPARSIT